MPGIACLGRIETIWSSTVVKLVMESMNRAMEWQKGMEINYTNFPMPKGKKNKKKPKKIKTPTVEVYFAFRHLANNQGRKKC